MTNRETPSGNCRPNGLRQAVILLALACCPWITPALAEDNSQEIFATQASVTDTISASTPEGVVVNDVSVGETSVSIQGTAQSNQQVSTFLRKLDQSGQFAGVSLTEIRSAGESDPGREAFSISARVKQ